MAIVTISRLFGAEGLTVARRVAELLGYSCLDRAIVTEVARMANVSEQEVERYDEKGQGLIEKLLIKIFGGPLGPHPIGGAGGDFVEMMVVPAPMGELDQSRIPDRQEVISMTQEVIQATARRGSAVIVGRGSQALLKDWPEALHVRLVAPLEFRIQRIAGQEGIDPEKAMVLVQQTDQNRARYILQHYKVDWEDSSLYHLVINTQLTGVETAANVIASAVTRGDSKGVASRKETL